MSMCRNSLTSMKRQLKGAVNKLKLVQRSAEEAISEVELSDAQECNIRQTEICYDGSNEDSLTGSDSTRVDE